LQTRKGRLVPALFVFLLLAVSCREAAPPAAAPPPANAGAQIQWEHIRTWTGRGSEYLDSFPSEGALRIEWESKRQPDAQGPGTLKIVMHSAISGRALAAPVVDQAGEGKGIAYFSEEPRVFFVAVVSEDVEWKIRISERVR
jgi:hypothetical protein